jgi:hypothetical protein
MAHENPSIFQSSIDRHLRGALLADKDVQRALRRLDEVAPGRGAIARRRRLLGNALRLTRSMAPAVVNALAACEEVLGRGEPVAVFVQPEPTLQAAAVRAPGEPPAIVLSARLIEVLTEAELRFVIGHELGHLALDHFALPLPATITVEDAGGLIVPRTLAFAMGLWSRAAEVSADRAGLLCARQLEDSASALLKLTSGLSSVSVKAELALHGREVDALLASPEAREKPREDEDTLGCFSTHPFSPPRVRALVAFSRSRRFREVAGSYASEEGISDEEVDALVARDLRMLEPSYLEEKSPRGELLRRALLLGGWVVALSERERSGVTAPLGALPGAERGGPPPSPDVARRELGEVLSRVRQEASMADRARLVQHLTGVTAPDGNITDAHYLELRKEAETLTLPLSLVDEALRGAARSLD